LKKENTAIIYATRLDFEVATPSQKASRNIGFKKKFKKALADKLGVKYKAIKKLFPKCLNSTLTANHLDTSVANFTHEEIREICQQLKLEFGEFR